jgi:hypothetical protein
MAISAFYVYLIDSSGNRIRYCYRGTDSYLLSDLNPYTVEIPVGPQKAIHSYATPDTFLMWRYDSASFSSFSWDRVQKVRFECTPNTAQTGTKQWGFEIDGLQFVGGLAIDPFADYAEIDSQVIQCLGRNAQSGVTTNEAIDINNSTPNDVALPPFQIAVVGDYMVFCGLTPFRNLKLKINQAAVYSGITLVWQYWNGTAWTALTCIDGSNGFKNAGTHWLTYNMPADWIRLDIGFGYPYYIIRCIVTALNAPSITTLGLAEQGWLQTGNNSPFIDSNSIALYGVHCLPAQDTLIDSFEYADREKWRLLNNLHQPIPTMDITVPVLSNLVHPSDLVTVTVPQLNISAQLWRIFHIHYEWDTGNKRIYQTLGVTQQTKPLPPLWAQQPELRQAVRR